MSVKVNFYDGVDDSLLRFAVIAARYNGRWIFCRHRERDTWEIPGGHREAGEIIEETARRELFEETGAREFSLRPVGVFSVTGASGPIHNAGESFGMLYFARVRELDTLPESEMAEIAFYEDLPEKLTYPGIQPALFMRTQDYLQGNSVICDTA